MVPIEAADGQKGFAPLAGGAIFNTAIALGRLGVDVSFFSGLSRDLFGQTLCRTLEASGVSSDIAFYSDLPTTLAFVRLEDGHATYTFYDENTAGRSFGPSDLPGRIDADALYFGGISLISEPAADAYRALAEREAGSKLIMLDPNIRPGFIDDEDRYRSRMRAMIAAADVIKVSDEDLAWLFPGQQVSAAIEVLQGGGERIVILTEGAKGATAFRAGKEPVFAASEKAEVVDTVGAGDTFNAGFLAALQKGGAMSKDRLRIVSEDELSAALALGAKVAAVTVSRKGANPPWASELGLS
jgi:fructokinase